MAVKYVKSSAGSVELMSCPAMAAGIEELTQRVASAAISMSRHDGSYVGDVRQGRTRCRGMVKTGDIGAVVDNSAHNTLLKALEGARS